MLVGYDISNDVLYRFAILTVALIASYMLGILLYSPYCPKQYIGLLDFVNLCCKRLALHKLVETARSCLHNKLEIVFLLNRECKTRQCDECIACTALEPRIAGKKIAFVLTCTVVELMSCINKTMEEVVARRTLVYFLIEETLQATSLAGRCRCGEHDSLALLDVHLEIARHIKVLVRSIATLLLLRILNARYQSGWKTKLLSLLNCM